MVNIYIVYIDWRERTLINYTDQQKKFCLSLYYNVVNSYIFVNGAEIYKFKAQDSEITAVPLCLDNVLKGFPCDNIKRQDYKDMSIMTFQFNMKVLTLMIF